MEMNRYRIYTENVAGKIDGALALVAKTFPAYSTFPGTGYWNGARESSIVIEIIAQNHIGDIQQLARALKAYLEQDAILITREPIVSMLV